MATAAPAAIHLGRLRERPAAVGRKHHLDAAVVVGIRKIIVPFLISPLISQKDSAVFQLDKIRIDINLGILSC